jgi:hypothetical protein
MQHRVCVCRKISHSFADRYAHWQPASYGEGGEAIQHKMPCSPFPFKSSLPLLLWRS